MCRILIRVSTPRTGSAHRLSQKRYQRIWWTICQHQRGFVHLFERRQFQNKILPCGAKRIRCPRQYGSFLSVFGTLLLPSQLTQLNKFDPKLPISWFYALAREICSSRIGIWKAVCSNRTFRMAIGGLTCNISLYCIASKCPYWKWCSILMFVAIFVVPSWLIDDERIWNMDMNHQFSDQNGYCHNHKFSSFARTKNTCSTIMMQIPVDIMFPP